MCHWSETIIEKNDAFEFQFNELYNERSCFHFNRCAWQLNRIYLHEKIKSSWFIVHIFTKYDSFTNEQTANGRRDVDYEICFLSFERITRFVRRYFVAAKWYIAQFTVKRETVKRKIGKIAHLKGDKISGISNQRKETCFICVDRKKNVTCITLGSLGKLGNSVQHP